MTSMTQNGDTPDTALTPAGVRPLVTSIFLLLLLAAIGLSLWRGPAILLDLAGYAQTLWCF